MKTQAAPTKEASVSNTPSMLILPWMNTLSERIIDTIKSSTVCWVVSGPAAGLTYFARRVFPRKNSELTVAYHRLLQDKDFLKSAQGLLATVVGFSAIRADWKFHTSTAIAKLLVEGIIRNDVDLLIIDGAENAKSDFFDLLLVIREELRDSKVQCGIVVMTSMPTFDSMSLGDETKGTLHRLGFTFRVGRMEENETANLLILWMKWDVTLQDRISKADEDAISAVRAIHHYTFGAFDLLLDFFDCFASINPGATLTLEAVEQAIAAKK